MTTKRHSLAATKRDLLGRKVKHLRTNGEVPGNVYAKHQDSNAITLNQKEFGKLYSEAGESTLVDLVIQGEEKSRPVLIREVQRHPVTGLVVHIDFQQVDLTEKVTAAIPVEVIGESEAVKAGGVLVVAHNEIEVEALPTDLPENFEVDISKLMAIGDTITIADLAFDKSKISIELEDEEVLVTVQAQEEEVVEEVVEPVEVELTKQGATKEIPEGEEGAPAPVADTAKKE
ncbi:MAG: 50S ribosomal protein L25 [Candidatus Woesebacteria bacterium]